MRKGREITIKVIKANYINTRKIAEFFAKKYVEEENKKS
jgi:hypothetical protein